MSSPQGPGRALVAQEEEAKLKLRGQEEPGEVTRHLGFAEQVLALKVVYMDSVLRNSMAEVWLRCALGVDFVQVQTWFLLLLNKVE